MGGRAVTTFRHERAPAGADRPWRVVEQPDKGPPIVHPFHTEDAARHGAEWLADKHATRERQQRERERGGP